MVPFSNSLKLTIDKLFELNETMHRISTISKFDHALSGGARKNFVQTINLELDFFYLSIHSFFAF